VFGDDTELKVFDLLSRAREVRGNECSIGRLLLVSAIVASVELRRLEECLECVDTAIGKNDNKRL